MDRCPHCGESVEQLPGMEVWMCVGCPWTETSEHRHHRLRTTAAGGGGAVLIDDQEEQELLDQMRRDHNRQILVHPNETIPAPPIPLEVREHIDEIIEQFHEYMMNQGPPPGNDRGQWFEGPDGHVQLPVRGPGGGVTNFACRDADQAQNVINFIRHCVRGGITATNEMIETFISTT